MKYVKRLLKFPLVIVFMGFVAVFSIVDSLTPEQQRTDYEVLTTRPNFSLSELLNNRYTPKYEQYVNDQFVLRDEFIDLKSRFEWLLTKVENNGVIYGDDDNMFAKLFFTESEQLKQNTAALGEFVGRHGDKVTVLIAPVASNILQDDLPFNPPMIDENAVIDDIFAAAQGANIVDVRDVLLQHSDEYIYYRNDHHWTTYGAYLAYEQYTQTHQLTPFDLSSAVAVKVPNFLGTHYSKSKYFASVPDTLTYYELDNTLTLDGEELPIYDLSKTEQADKYAIFLQGNPGFVEVQGDGKGRVLVIKDSYANSFVPFLTANYERIDIIDYRLYNGSATELINEEQYDDVLILYNSTTFAEDGNFAKILFN